MDEARTGLDGLSAVDRLAELLNQRDAEVAALKEELRRRDEAEDREAWSWARHTVSPENEELPVPRLEVRWSRLGGGDWNWLAVYSLIYRHLLGHVVCVPLGATRTSGCREPTTVGQVDLPFRERAHILHDAEELRLPAFAVFAGVVDAIYIPPADPAHSVRATSIP